MAFWLLTPSAVEAEAIRRGLPRGFRASLYVTGVGALATLHTLWQLWEREPRPSALIVLGIAGSYTAQLLPGSVVWVEQEIWGDLGKRKRQYFVPTPEVLRPPFPLELRNPFLCPLSLPTATGLTLHTVSGSWREARYWHRAYPHAQLETQENYAYFLFAHTWQVPLASLRVVANRVGTAQWDFAAAWAGLQRFCYTELGPLLDSFPRT